MTPLTTPHRNSLIPGWTLTADRSAAALRLLELPDQLYEEAAAAGEKHDLAKDTKQTPINFKRDYLLLSKREQQPLTLTTEVVFSCLKWTIHRIVATIIDLELLLVDRFPKLSHTNLF